MITLVMRLNVRDAGEAGATRRRDPARSREGRGGILGQTISAPARRAGARIETCRGCHGVMLSLSLPQPVTPPRQYTLAVS